jgi:hypothetical protein
MREYGLIKYDFAAASLVSTVAGQTQSGLPTAYANVEPFAYGGFYAPSEFNGDTITFQSLIAGTAYTKLTKTAATGWNFFTADELVQIASSGNLSISTGTATAGAASIYLELKS